MIPTVGTMDTINCSPPRPSWNLLWYAKRARVMRPAEIVHRLGQQCRVMVMRTVHRTGWRTARHTQNAAAPDSSRFSFCLGLVPQLPDPPWAVDLDAVGKAAVLDGQVAALGSTWQWREHGSVWHEAPDTGRPWPRKFFAEIPYRPGNSVGDVRVAWEPARLQHLVTLALLARSEAPDVRQRAVAMVEAQLCSWVEANPPLTGIHYISVMECALRLLAASYALDLVRPWLQHPERTWGALLTLVAGHADLIARRLSVHSSSGNHTIAEAAGLIHAGMLFPEMPGAAGWVKLGLSLLEQEAPRQILTDGGGAEQAFWYEWFVADLLGLVVLLLEHRHSPVPSSLRSAHERAIVFLGTFGRTSRELPSIGDGDDGYALSPFLSLSSATSERSRVRSFEGSGYSLIRIEDPEQAALIFDHGSLGMPPCYGHGHADALSVVLQLGAQTVLLDPGTYAYGSPGPWRMYFRGTAAHNTVMVDGLDQAVQEGPFLWTWPYAARLVRREVQSDGTVLLLACHDGYVRRSGVRHWRAVQCRPRGNWLIWDCLTGEGIHDLDLHWHAATEVQALATSYVLRTSGRALCLSVEGGETTLHRGEQDPIRGWSSPRYGQLAPITTLRAHCRTSLPHEFLTRLWPADRPEPIESVTSSLALFRRWIDEAQTR